MARRVDHLDWPPEIALFLLGDRTEPYILTGVHFLTKKVSPDGGRKEFQVGKYGGIAFIEPRRE